MTCVRRTVASTHLNARQPPAGARLLVALSATEAADLLGRAAIVHLIGTRFSRQRTDCFLCCFCAADGCHGRWRISVVEPIERF